MKTTIFLLVAVSIFFTPTNAQPEDSASYTKIRLKNADGTPSRFLIGRIENHYERKLKMIEYHHDGMPFMQFPGLTYADLVEEPTETLIFPNVLRIEFKTKERTNRYNRTYYFLFDKNRFGLDSKKSNP